MLPWKRCGKKPQNGLLLDYSWQPYCMHEKPSWCGYISSRWVKPRCSMTMQNQLQKLDCKKLNCMQKPNCKHLIAKTRLICKNSIAKTWLQNLIAKNQFAKTWLWKLNCKKLNSQNSICKNSIANTWLQRLDNEERSRAKTR